VSGAQIPAMPDRQANAALDRMLIRELIDAYSNICTRKDFGRLGDLFIEDCVWRTRGTTPREFAGRDTVVAAISAVVQSYPFIFQMPHAPLIDVDGDTARATTLMHEVGKMHDETTSFAIGIYHDVLARTAQGWKFRERLFEAIHREP
jgi:ketosteroid isomerase-like protein